MWGDQVKKRADRMDCVILGRLRLEKSNIILHMPYRSWCPSCVSGKVKDRQHRKQDDQSEKSVTEVVFDYDFGGTGVEGEETVAIQVARDRRSHMLFAHVVPRKGMNHEHGAKAMAADLDKLGYGEAS